MPVRVVERPSIVPTVGDAELTVTRAGDTATRVNKQGLIEVVNANLPRFDYDPITLAVRGTLAEVRRVNRCLQSEALNTSPWSAGGTASVTEAVASHKGLSFCRVTTGGSTSVLVGTITVVGDGIKAVSLFVKSDGHAGTIPMAFWDNTASVYRLRFTVTVNADGTISAAIVSSTGTLLGVVPLGDGVYRIELATTSGVVATNTNLIYVLDGGSSITSYLATGAQVEDALFPSSYIPTSSAAVTRNADVPRVALGDWLNHEEGTIVVEASVDALPVPGAFNATIASFYTTGSSNSIQLRVTNTSNLITLIVQNASVVQADITAGSAVTVGTAFRAAAAWKADDFALSANGSAVSTDSSGSLPAIATVDLGAIAGEHLLFGHLRRFAYYRRRLLNAQLQTLSAGGTIDEQPSLAFDFTSESVVDWNGLPLSHARIGYENHVRDAAVEASTSAEDFPAEAVKYDNTHERWKPTALPATLRADLGEAKIIDYSGIAVHSLGSSGVELALEWSPNDTDWYEIETFTPEDDSEILTLFPPLQARYWRLRPISGDAVPFIGVWYLGRVLTMARPFYRGHQPLSMSRQTAVRPAMSEKGQWLGNALIRMGLASSAEWRNLPADWVRAKLDPFIKSARSHPYFFAWRPDEYPAECHYCWTQQDIRPVHSGPRKLMSVGVPMEAFTRETD